MANQNIRTLFLQEFVKSLIKSSKPQKIEITIPDYVSQPNQRTIQEIQKNNLDESFIFLPKLPSLPQLPSLTGSRNIPLPTKARKMQMQFLPGSSPLDKLLYILKDPAVIAIESPGPDKNVLVNRSGAIQVAPLTLSKEETDTIMASLSQLTSIPLIKGVFKAAYQNLLITAVLSDFVGTRFIIQKRIPRMPF